MHMSGAVSVVRRLFWLLASEVSFAAVVKEREREDYFWKIWLSNMHNAC